MSRYVHITNLPLYYDDYGLQDIFSEVGEITATAVTKNDIISKSTGFVEFASSKHARLAASKKDQIVIGNSAVRVYLVWTQEEDLSTVKVSNIESDTSETDLGQYFAPYGGIVDVRIVHSTAAENNDDEKTSTAFVSFCRVDYALQAVQEMDGTIVGSCGALGVQLLNPDARNLKWKRNSFEYKRMNVPHLNSMTQTAANHYQNKHTQRRPHRHHRSRFYQRQSEAMQHEQNQQQQQQQQRQQTASASNPNIIIVNNIGSIHNNTNTKEGDNQYTHTQNNSELLHPFYGNNHQQHYRRAQHFDDNSHPSQRHSHSLSPNGPGSRGHHGGRRDKRHRAHGRDESYHHADTYDDEHRRQQQQQQQQQQRGHRTRNYRSQRSTQSTLFGPLHNFSNGQYRTYSVTPSPTRSADDVDSATEQQHVQQQSKRRALDHYGGNAGLHSPQPYQAPTTTTTTTTTMFLPAPAHTMSTPISPATTVSTPSTTHSIHSMPTPTGYTGGGNTYTLLSGSKTPTTLSIPGVVLNTPTGLSPSATTPVSTPPSTVNLKHVANPVFAPQTQANLNYLQAMNFINVNHGLYGVDNGMSALHIQPSLIPSPQPPPQAAMATPPNCNTSPIVLPPHANLLLQTQIGQVPAAHTHPSVIISPPNLQQPFVFNSPQSPPRFMYNASEDENRSTRSNNSNGSSKKSKKSGSHAWTKEQEELGNKLYKLVTQKYPDHATKVVGMLLMGHSAEDLKFMMERPAILMPLIQNYNEKQLARKKRKSMAQQQPTPSKST